MAHPQSAEASVVPANDGSTVGDFADFLDSIDVGDDEDEEDSGADPDEVDGEEPETDDTTDDEAEPETPAIDPPVSWSADAKELFAQLPPELQSQIAERETQRERAIQKATTDAAEARRNAAVEANAQFAGVARQYAEQLEHYASLMSPQRPSPALLQQDPVRFYQMQAEYEAAVAQHSDMQRRAEQSRAQALELERQAEAEIVARDNHLLATEIPDWVDPAKRYALLTDLEKVGAELGYPQELMTAANAHDILALRKAAEWRSKAAKYDALQGTKMAKVRAAKALPKVSKPGVAPSNGEISASRAEAAWQGVKGARSKNAQADAFAAFLETGGYL